MAKENPAASAAPPKGPSAKPGTKEPKAKKEKKVRVDYVVPEGGLPSWPADYDPKVHKPLRRKDFADETVYLEMKAGEYERRAKQMREEIVTVRTMGNSKDRARAKQLLKMTKRMEELKGELTAEGVDVNELLKSLAAAADKK